MLCNTTQANLWNRAQLYGRRSRPRLSTFNDAKLGGPTTRKDGAKLSPYVSRHSVGVLFSDPDGSTSPERMGEWLGSLGLAYDPELGAVPLGGIPKSRPERAPRQASAPKPAQPAPASTGPDPVAEAFRRFGKAPAFRKAFTSAGKLRKGWELGAGGIPCWSEATAAAKAQGVVRF